MIEIIDMNTPFSAIRPNTLYYADAFNHGYTTGGACLYSNGELYFCSANLKQKNHTIQGLEFADEQRQITIFPLNSFKDLQNWLLDSKHFNLWTNYPLTAWNPEDVQRWQSGSIETWTVYDILNLMLILETIRYTDDEELRTALPSFLEFISYTTFQAIFKQESFLKVIQFN